MRVHIYRPLGFVGKLRKLKFRNDKGNLLSYAMDDSEVLINDAPSTIKANMDWMRGKIENLSGEDVYLICYANHHSMLQCLIPSEAKKYFVFKPVSQKEYEQAIASKGKSLDIMPKISKTKSLASRMLSFMMLTVACILFYLTDYSSMKIDSEEIEFIRLLGVIAGFSSLVGVIWNVEKYVNLNARGTMFLLLTAFFAFMLFRSGVGIELFLIPVVGILLIMFWYNRDDERTSNYI